MTVMEQLAFTLAGTAAESYLDCCSYSSTIDGVEWMFLNEEDLDACSLEIRYLELREVLVRNYDNPGMLRIQWAEECDEQEA